MKRKSVDFEIMDTEGRIREEGSVEVTEEVTEDCTRITLPRSLEFHGGETLTIHYNIESNPGV